MDNPLFWAPIFTRKNAMPQHQVSTLIVTTSAICGGMSQMVTSPCPLAAITLTNVSEVALYAAISALVGYGVKMGIDKIKRMIRGKRP